MLVKMHRRPDVEQPQDTTMAVNVELTCPRGNCESGLALFPRFQNC